MFFSLFRLLVMDGSMAPKPKEDLILLFIVLASCVGGWLLPERYLYAVFGVLILGLLFDLLSLFYYIMTRITGRFISGFPLVGLYFYGWFLLAYPKSLAAPQETSLSRVVLYKLVDGSLLAVLHLLFQLPVVLKNSRDGRRERGE